jgi:hypothetical protein
MTESSYNPGVTIEQVARNDYRGIWQAARDGKLDAAESYEIATYTAIQVTLSGGGPGADLVFVLTDPLEEGGEVREGFFSYYEADGSHVIPIGARDGQMLLDALTGRGELPADEDEEDDDEPRQIRGLLIPADLSEPMRVVETPAKLDDLYRIVGVSTLDSTRLGRDFTGWVDDEGALNGSPVNVRATNLRYNSAAELGIDPGQFRLPLFGNVFVVGDADEEGEETSAPDRILELDADEDDSETEDRG